MGLLAGRIDGDTADRLVEPMIELDEAPTVAEQVLAGRMHPAG